MKYSRSINIQSGDDFDFSPIESILLPNNFRILGKKDSAMEFSGQVMQSTSENPIRGATKISLEVISGQLVLKAMLGGVLMMSLFVCIFPLLLTTFLHFGNQMGMNHSGVAWAWLLACPALVYWLRSRTIKALDDMLDNAVCLQPFNNKHN